MRRWPRSLDDPAIAMGTAARRFRATEELSNPNLVKVVRDDDGRALYFSRAPIPFSRDAAVPALARVHVGLYVYRRDTLLRLAALAPSPLELAESLEQLRALEHGIRIHVVDTDYVSFEVNTPDDLAHVRQHLLAATHG